MLMSNDNRMEVVFQTRSSSTAKGFRAHYKFVTGEYMLTYSSSCSLSVRPLNGQQGRIQDFRNRGGGGGGVLCLTVKY